VIAKAHPEPTRRDFLNVASMAAAGTGLMLAAWPFIDAMNPSAAARALVTEVDLSTIAPGQQITVMWASKPMWVRHRAAREIESASTTPLSALKEPQADADRIQRSEWLVVVAICSLLDCIPFRDNTRSPGGYLCPCCGSAYDASGRVLDGPAPRNLAVPHYTFVTDDRIRFG
jgi:ubiquinol-cytochrome c reductase iron-sulfur subunit